MKDMIFQGCSPHEIRNALVSHCMLRIDKFRRFVPFTASDIEQAETSLISMKESLLFYRACVQSKCAEIRKFRKCMAADLSGEAKVREDEIEKAILALREQCRTLSIKIRKIAKDISHGGETVISEVFLYSGFFGKQDWIL